jgi:nucleotide-binding universal stress UspA family protein
MSAPRRLLVAIAGTEDLGMPEQVARVGGSGGPDLEITLLHVSEIAPRGLVTFDPGIRRGPWPLPRRDAIEQRLTSADDEGTAALLTVWHERFAVALPNAQIKHLVARGRPEQEIIAAAGRLNADAVILCARPRTGSTEPGPRSLGHVARFVVDHSPVPVLVIRRPPESTGR